MAILSDPIKSLLFLRELGLEVSEETKEKLKDMGYIIPEKE